MRRKFPTTTDNQPAARPVTSVLARALTAVVTAVLGAAVTLIGTITPVSASPTFPFPWPDYSVVPILFVPRDWSTGSTEVQQEAAALRSAMTEIQQFYAAHNGGKTFKLNALNVVQADGPKESYGIRWNGRSIYADGVELAPMFENSVIGELNRRGFPTPPAQNTSGYSTLIFAKGAGGYAGAREFPQGDGGWGILGDWAVDSIQGQVAEGAYAWSGRRKQTGAAAHELGHTFDLPHPDVWGGANESTVMGAWWSFPTVGLSDFDRNRLATSKSKFFTTVLATPPTAPTGPASAPLDAAQIRVSWADQSNNETGFRVSDGVANWTVAANSTSFTLGGLAAGTYKCFKVQAYNAAGNSAWVPGPPANYTCTTTPTPPAAPTNAAVTALNRNQMRVSWADRSNNETGFRITDGGTTWTVAANSTTFTLSGLAANTYKCFRIQAFNAAGGSAWAPGPPNHYVCTTTPR